MIDHLGVTVAEMKRSLAFYDDTLAPLCFARVMVFPEEDEPVRLGYGRGRKPFFRVGAGPAASGPLHVAFAAPNRNSAPAFHAAARKAGGVDYGTPGLRPDYRPTDYAAFVLDPDGDDVEAAHRAL